VRDGWLGQGEKAPQMTRVIKGKLTEQICFGLDGFSKVITRNRLFRFK
jgi:hypothetical protein